MPPRSLHNYKSTEVRRPHVGLCEPCYLRVALLPAPPYEPNQGQCRLGWGRVIGPLYPSDPSPFTTNNTRRLQLAFGNDVSEYGQEIPPSQTADKPMAPRGRATQQSRDTRKTKPSKATSSLFPIKMIAKLEWT